MRRIAVGTEKGGYLLTESSGGTWMVEGPQFPGWKVSAFGETGGGDHLAAIASNWFGIGIHISPDWSQWADLGAPPVWPENTGRAMEQIWALHRDGSRLWAGTSQAGLFTSDDDGRTWAPVDGLNEHPTRDQWQPGFGGLAAHRILTSGEQIWVGISAVGVFRSDDGGATWSPKNLGVHPVDTADDAAAPEVGYCVHGLAQDPQDPLRIWRQDHRGVFRTVDGGDSWQRIENGLPAGFGFVMWRDRASGRLLTVPLHSDENRVPVEGRLRAYGSDDDGESWAVAGEGWSEAPQFTGVLRGAFDGDDDGNFCFGTTGGKIWITNDRARTWRELQPAFPRIYSLSIVR